MIVFLLGMKASTGLAFNGVFLAAFDIFPIKYSASIFGMLNITGTLFAIVSPMIAEIEFPVPVLVFIGLSILPMITSCVFL